MTADPYIRLNDVSKWYGEILGVNRITAEIRTGFSGMVGPNGSGKSTLMNLIGGLVRPSRGSVSVCGVNPVDTCRINRLVGYVHQFDEIYPMLTGLNYLVSLLLIDGYSKAEALQRSEAALDRVTMLETKHQRMGAYSKGMKQRLKIARALAREPAVLVLDEPLGGLDPVSRKELSDLFLDYADEGHIVLMSSHILAEIEHLTRSVIMLDNGSIVAEGDLDNVRRELKSIPLQIFLKTKQPEKLAGLLFEQRMIQAAAIDSDQRGLTIKTDDADSFLLSLNKLAMQEQFSIDFVATVDDSMESIYRYLIVPTGSNS